MPFREIVSGLIGALLLAVLSKAYNYILKWYSNRDLFKKIFSFDGGVVVNKSGFFVGNRYVVREADNKVELVISAVKLKNEGSNEKIDLHNPTKNMILIGSSRFNRLSWELQKFFDFPYQFVYSMGGSDQMAGNLSIVTEYGDEFVSSIDRQPSKNNLEIDYGLLFIGNLPNEKRVIWIAGIHGAGTRGVVEHLRNNPRSFYDEMSNEENTGTMWLIRINYEYCAQGDNSKILKTEMLGKPKRVKTAPVIHVDGILFDLGNVLMDFDRDRTYRAIARTLGRNYEDIRDIIEKSDIRQGYEDGSMGTDSFIKKLALILGADNSELSESKLREFWGDIFWENKEMHQVLKEIKLQGISLGLLSNTNPLHFEHIQGTYPDLIGLFDHLVLSYKEGTVKPDDKIFLVAKEKVKKSPSGPNNNLILYVDDIQEYTMKAQSLQIESHTYKSYPHFIFWLRRHGIYIQ